MIAFSLKEFSYGVDRIREMRDSVNPLSPMMRFYSNALYQYASSYFLLAGDKRLCDVLSAVGSGDLLSDIQNALSVPMGSTTFGEIIRAFRNKFLTHESFEPQVIDKHIHKNFDLDDPTNQTNLEVLINQLFTEIQKLLLKIYERFPEIK